MIRENSRYDIPVFVYFKEKNPFFGSFLNLRFKILLVEESLQLEIWNGPLCYEKSEILQTHNFEASENGLNEAVKLLDELAIEQEKIADEY